MKQKTRDEISSEYKWDLTKIYETDEMFIKNAKGVQKVKPSRYYDKLYDIDEPEKMAAINKAKICKKPIAGYDKQRKVAYVEYANGEKMYAE